MKKFRLLLFVFVLFLTACQQQMESLSDEAVGELTSAKDRLWMIKEIHQGVETKAVAEKSKTWQSGDIIRIKFLNGTEAVQNKVKQYASLWLEYADLVFEYVENDADVKISFDWDGKLVSWSTIGTDCRLVPQNESSLNFVYLDDPDEEFVRGEVLRAFGHVLGLGFEHKSPASPLVFKATAAATLQDYYGLTPEEVTDFIAQYQADQTNYTEYDKNSIMVAEIPGSILENRRLATVFNTELSQNDIDLISELYKSVEPQKSIEVEVLLDGIYPIRNTFFVDYLGENIYYVQPESFPIDYEGGRPSIMKMNLNNRIKTKMFELDEIITAVVVDKQENFYITLVNMPLSTGLHKYNRYGTMIQEMKGPAGYLFAPRYNPIAMDCNDYLYCFTSTRDFPKPEYPGGVVAGPVFDTTYIFRSVSGGFTCLKKFEHIRNIEWSTPLVSLTKGNMILHYGDNQFFQMDIPSGQTLVKKKSNFDFDHYCLITNRNSELIYLLGIKGNKTSLYHYYLDRDEISLIGELPSTLVNINGTVINAVSYHEGEILNNNELLLTAVDQESHRTLVVKVNMLTKE